MAARGQIGATQTPPSPGTIIPYGSPDNAGEAFHYGTGDFIVKPFILADVINKVKPIPGAGGTTACKSKT